MQNKHTVTVLVVFISSLFLCSGSQAKISHLELKGIHELINPEYQAQLSPIFGYTLIETKTLENRRFYGNYGLELKDHDCFDENTTTGEDLRKNNDCPQDHTSELIQRLFPSGLGSHLEINSLVRTDPIARLRNKEIGGKVIGKVLNEIAKFKPDQWKKEESEPLKKGLLGILEDNLVNKKTPSNSKHRKNENSEKQKCAKFVDVLVSALNASRQKTEHRDAPHYPKYLPEHVLMAFFLMIADEKKDLIPLLKEMAFPEIWKQKEIPSELLGEKYDISHYKPEELDSEKTAQDFIRDPEKLDLLVFSARQSYFSRQLPPILEYSPLTQYNGKQYPDCVETSLRNLLNIFTYDNNDNKFHEQYLKPECLLLSNESPVYKFFHEHNEAAESVQQKHYNDWSNVVSGLGSSVQYCQPSEEEEEEKNRIYEIKSGLDNAINVFKQLFLQTASDKAHFEGFNKLSENLDALCQLFSRDDFILDWEAEVDSPNKEGKPYEIDRCIMGETNRCTTIKVLFKIDGKNEPSFTWNFIEHHSEVVDLTSKEPHINWIMTVGKEFVHHFNQITGKETPTDEQIKLLLPWFASQERVTEITSPEAKEDLLYSLDFSTTQSQFGLLKLLMGEQFDRTNAVVRTVLTKLIQKLLNGTDVKIKTKTLKLLFKKNFPDIDNTITKLFKNNKNLRNLVLLVSAELGDKPVFERIYNLKENESGELQLPSNHNKDTPAHLAAREGKSVVFKFIVDEYPESLNAINNEDQTPAHLAARWGHLDVIEIIVDKSCDSLKRQDKNRKTPILLVDKEKYKEVFALIKDKCPESLIERDWAGYTVEGSGRKDEGNNDQTSAHSTKENTLSDVDLVWSEVANVPMNYINAVEHCKKWDERLPTRKEWTDKWKDLTELPPDVKGRRFWSSSDAKDGSKKVFIFIGKDGEFNHYYYHFNHLSVQCVKEVKRSTLNSSEQIGR